MITLGINAPPRGWHDTAACLVVDGELVAFGEEERFSRCKHAIHQTPRNAISFCLEKASLAIEDVDVIAVGWDVPKVVGQDNRNHDWLNPRNYIEYLLGAPPPSDAKPELVLVPHHLAHASCAFYASPFSQAAVLVVDGIGEDCAVSMYSASISDGLKEGPTWPASHSLGLLYDGACQSVGFSFLEAGKLMGLAAFGRAKAIEPWPLVELQSSDYVLALTTTPKDTHTHIVERWLRTFRSLQGGSQITIDKFSLHRDELAVRTAWSAQHCVEEVVQWLAAYCRGATGLTELCLAGGVALNCSANGLIPDPVYIPPIAHDSGTALGAAWYVSPPDGERRPLNPFAGLHAGDVAETDFLLSVGSRQLFDADTVIEWLLKGKIGGIVEGRAEIGPRALGHRSIVALPRPATQRDRVNALKHREPWRPFAPVGLSECNGKLWPARSYLFQYMIGATRVIDTHADTITATTHVDGTARPQIVDADHGLVAQLLCRMRAGGVPPVLLNTSFNGPGSPIVNTAHDAVETALLLGLDFLVIEKHMMRLH
ncbi:MAG: carbamoyltransferase [Acidobacteria bacterium]|nr:carbamoyltransferase [Acidobacteriota bacterium]